MSKLKQTIESLETAPIPKHYQWGKVKGFDLEDQGFPNVCDCLHKHYNNLVEPFPDDFDIEMFNRKSVSKVVTQFIRIDPEQIILAQRYIEKSTVLELLDTPNFKAIQLYKCGDYYVMKDGHHRLFLRYLRNQSVLAKVAVLH